MSRAILNIISNSIKYKVSDQVIISVSIEIKSNYIAMTIADNGAGVEDEVWQYLNVFIEEMHREQDREKVVG